MSQYKYYIKRIYQPSTDTVVIEAGDRGGLPVFNYKPGQYAMISYRNAKGQTEDKHAFSISSSPTQRNIIRFGIKIGGTFTQGLLTLKEGDELIIAGPYGKFVYDENKYSDLVLIAGGIGITPFVSALRYATERQLNNKLSLIYSAKKAAGATFYEEINALKKINPNISTLYSFTEETDLSKYPGVINKRIDAETIKNFIGNIYGKSFFICGPTLFMNAMVTNLNSLGVRKDQIEMEEFSMIPDHAFWSRMRNLSYAVTLAAVLFMLTFSLVNKSAASTSAKKANLNSQILAVANSSSSLPVSTINLKSPTPRVIRKKSVVQPIVQQPTYIAPMPAPMPTTRMS